MNCGYKLKRLKIFSGHSRGQQMVRQAANWNRKWPTASAKAYVNPIVIKLELI